MSAAIEQLAGYPGPARQDEVDDYRRLVEQLHAPAIPLPDGDWIENLACLHAWAAGEPVVPLFRRREITKYFMQEHPGEARLQQWGERYVKTFEFLIRDVYQKHGPVADLLPTERPSLRPLVVGTGSSSSPLPQFSPMSHASMQMTPRNSIYLPPSTMTAPGSGGSVSLSMLLGDHHTALKRPRLTFEASEAAAPPPAAEQHEEDHNDQARFCQTCNERMQFPCVYSCGQHMVCYRCYCKRLEHSVVIEKVMERTGRNADATFGLDLSGMEFMSFHCGHGCYRGDDDTEPNLNTLDQKAASVTMLPLDAVKAMKLPGHEPEQLRCIHCDKPLENYLMHMMKCDQKRVTCVLCKERVLVKDMLGKHEHFKHCAHWECDNTGCNTKGVKMTYAMYKMHRADCTANVNKQKVVALWDAATEELLGVPQTEIQRMATFLSSLAPRRFGTYGAAELGELIQSWAQHWNPGFRFDIERGRFAADPPAAVNNSDGESDATGGESPEY